MQEKHFILFRYLLVCQMRVLRQHVGRQVVVFVLAVKEEEVPEGLGREGVLKNIKSNVLVGKLLQFVKFFPIFAWEKCSLIKK